MPGFDLIWFGLCGIYLFQLRKEKGVFYEKMRDIAAKKSTFDKNKFKRMQHIQVSLCVWVIVGFRLFQVLSSHRS
jgi:hypothetical protein